MTSLAGQTLGRFRVLEQIGAGGMGVVYRARDQRLGRDVAIKVLPEEVSQDPERLRRFEREARAAAAIGHPNILAVYDVGAAEVSVDAGDERREQGASRTVHYLVTELLEGETLRERIESGALTVTKAVELAKQVAEGVAAAHDKGIVHRDLKPDNVFVTVGGAAKLLDFGLAKLTPLDLGVSDDTPGPTISAATATGAVMGTVGYMAPEQVRGQKADHRADLFALGCMLYEMLSGKRAFDRESPAETLAAILGEDPAPLSQVRRGVPLALVGLVSKCLEKRPEDRLSSAHDLALTLAALDTAAVGRPQGLTARLARPRSLVLAGAAVAVVMLVMLSSETLRERWRGASGDRMIRSLAVLPLENLTGEADQVYFVDGVHEALVSELSSIQALAVRSRTSVLGYRETTSTIPEIAEELGVDAVVEGSVMRDGGRVAVTVQLIDGVTDDHLWRETFEYDLADVLRLRSEVAQAIAEEIRVVVTPEEQEELASAPAVNPEAFDLYLRGRHQLEQWYPELTARAVESFQRSLDIDPGFAPAWGGLALATVARGVWVGGNEDPREVLPVAERAVRRALALDDAQVDAHLALAGIDGYFKWRWDEAERRLRLAAELDPEHARVRVTLANFLTMLGRPKEGETQAREAVRLAPLSPLAVNELVAALRRQGRSDEAWEYALMALDLDPHFPQSLMFRALDFVERGHVEQGLAMADEALRVCPDSLDAFFYAARAYRKAGQRERADQIIAELESRAETGFVPPGLLFRVYLERGDVSRALDMLEQAYEQHDPRMLMLRLMSRNPALAAVTAEPRFQEIFRRMNFPEE